MEVVKSISDTKKISSKEIKDNIQTIEKISNNDKSKVSSQSTQFRSIRPRRFSYFFLVIV